MSAPTARDRGRRPQNPSAAVPSWHCGWLRRCESLLPLEPWLGAGLVALPYVHMAAKYLLPAVPAAALLVVLHGAHARQKPYPLTVALLIAMHRVRIISSPGAHCGCRLPAALVCTSTSQPISRSTCSGTFMPCTSPLS